MSTPKVPVLHRKNAEKRSAHREAAHYRAKVRIRRRVGPEVGPTPASHRCIPTGVHGPTRVVRAKLTPPCSLQEYGRRGFESMVAKEYAKAAELFWKVRRRHHNPHLSP